ncbi:MAG: RluA family pseudouridine synthase [Proteobacteria bacterium]|nr:RluA family pseudouridine synthase [Pseudomonadota bacterium]
MHQIFEITVPPLEKKVRLDAFLAENIPSLSRTRLKSLISSGMVFFKEKPIYDTSYTVKEGESFQVKVPPAQEAFPQAQSIPLSILYEDDDILVIDKPAGLTVHPAPGNPDSTLVNALLAHCGESLSGIGGVKRPGIVHRLDKETSGLMVVAKSDTAHQGLMLQFKERLLSRKYKAFISGGIIPLHGTIEKNIERSHKDRKKMTVVKKEGRPAKTDYKTLQVFKKKETSKIMASLLECKLHTGRTHQIRVHLSSLHHPILGDETYGHTPKNSPLGHLLERLHWKHGRQALHAYSLQFFHPLTQDLLSFESPFPEDMQQLQEALEAL